MLCCMLCVHVRVMCICALSLLFVLCCVCVVCEHVSCLYVLV